MRQPRGFTLVEILLALVIMGVVTGALYRVLNTTQRLSRAQAEQVSLQSNVRTGSLLVPSELRELNTWAGSADAWQNDILIAESDRIRYRAMRGLYTICQSPAVNNQVQVFDTDVTAYRDPEAGRDGLYVFIEGDPDREQDDKWIPVAVSAVATGNVCPGGLASITLTTPATPELVGLDPGTPVRIYEVMQMQLYQDAGKSWLGAYSVSNGDVAPQPMLGPLTDGDGFLLEYFDANGNAPVDLSAITSIRVTVRGLTDEVVRINGAGDWGHPQEALVSQVLLRNSIRP
jgi:prepilin-type N-terminal cleavage/methylation domain-containing protein